MKIFKVTYVDVTSVRVKWCGSEVKAKKIRADLRRESRKPGSGIDAETLAIEKLDLPVDKEGLLAFLNNGCVVRE